MMRRMGPLRIALKTRMEIYIFGVAHFAILEVLIKDEPNLYQA